MAIFYVDPTGSDSANGSSATPFKTISHALRANLRPGDEIVVRPGTYVESLQINKGGSAAGDITIRSEVPGQALIKPNSGWNAISVNANYVTIEGFEIEGADGDGIEANSVHHITVRDNVIHGNGESGIQFNYSDFIVVEGNETYENASSGWFSGISIYQNRNITGDTTTTGYRTIVRNNISHDNVTYSGQHTDGNGIIIDDFQSTQTSGHPNYTFPTLVEGNLVYANGGKGIQVTWSDFVTVSGNTAYHNNVDLANSGTWRGEISNAQSSNNTFVNNIAVADPSINSNNTAFDNNSYGGYSNRNIVWDSNVLFNGVAGQLSVRNDGGNTVPRAADGNLIGVDPHFVDPANGNFELSEGSPAIDAGTSVHVHGTEDVDGDSRIVGTVDIGAQEFVDTALPADPIGQAGTVTVEQADRTQWHTVTFDVALDNPSVVMGPLTTNGKHPATVAVRNVTDTGFEYQIQEWDYLDGRHTGEQVSWLAIEAGTHVLANGQTIVAGSTDASATATTVSFAASAFADTPLVLAQTTTNRTVAVVTDRISSIGADGFQVALVDQEANTWSLRTETVDWIAIGAGDGRDGGLLAGSVGSIRHSATALDLGTVFDSDQFVFVADMQTHNDSDTATLALTDRFVDGLSLHVQEERSLDAEMRHRSEVAGYVALDQGLIFADLMGG